MEKAQHRLDFFDNLERTAVKLSVFALLHALLVGLDHFLERVTRRNAGF